MTSYIETEGLEGGEFNAYDDSKISSPAIIRIGFEPEEL